MTDVLQGNEELARLAGAADALARAVDAEAGQLSDAAQAVAGRIHDARFEVAVVGEFNRGKSTLVNALVGRSVLPFGALPVTSIPIEVSGGDEGAVVRFMDGTEKAIDFAELETYATEESNPGNTLKVDGVMVSLPAPVLRHGAVLLDTPGLNSLFRHSADAARERIVEADGAIVVLSADSPLTEAERNLLQLLKRRSARTFFVLNRIDHMTDEDLERVGWFVENVLERVFGEAQELFRISARTGQGMSEFFDAFERFLTDHLDDARVELARRDLASLAGRIEDDIALEESALAMDATELGDRVEAFRQTTAWQREGAEDDRILFEHAVGRLAAGATERLHAAAAAGPSPEAGERIRQLVQGTKRSELREAAAELIDREVHSQLDPVASEEAGRVREGWHTAAERFERATRRRVEKLRELAGELFDVELHPTPPPPAIERWTPSPSEAAATEISEEVRRVVGPFTTRAGRARALEELLATELRGRAAVLAEDLARPLKAASTEVEAVMQRQVDAVVDAMDRAIERAQEAKTSTEEASARAERRSSRLRKAAREARMAVESARI